MTLYVVGAVTSLEVDLTLEIEADSVEQAKELAYKKLNEDYIEFGLDFVIMDEGQVDFHVDYVEIADGRSEYCCQNGCDPCDEIDCVC